MVIHQTSRTEDEKALFTFALAVFVGEVQSLHSGLQWSVQYRVGVDKGFRESDSDE